MIGSETLFLARPAGGGYAPTATPDNRTTRPR
jgi:hypothetical protein